MIPQGYPLVIKTADDHRLLVVGWHLLATQAWEPVTIPLGSDAELAISEDDLGVWTVDEYGMTRAA